MRSLFTFYRRTLVLAFLLIFPSVSFAGDFNFKRMIVLGDTLSDGGSYSQAMWAIGKPRNIYYRVLENNPDGSSKVWAEFVANGLGLDLNPNVLRGATETVAGTPIHPALQISETDIALGGTNYAELGSRVTGTSEFENTSAGLTAISVVQQVDKVLADNNGKLKKTDLVAIWAGSEDAISSSYVFENNPALIPQAVAELSNQIDRLKEAGARNIIVLTVPVTTEQIPDAGIGAIFNPLYRTYNDLLKKELAGKDGVVIQTQKLTDATVLNPTRFGFVSTGVTCDNDALACVIGTNTDPGQGPFTRSDATHPSALMHKNYADLVFATLKGASQNAGMAGTSMSTIRQSGVSLEMRLIPGAMEHTDPAGKLIRRLTGDIQTHANISGGYSEENDGQVNPGSKSRTLSLNLGADIAVTKNALVGINVSYNKSDVDFGEDSGGFDNRTVIGSLYTNISVTNSIYVNAVASAGHIDLDDITRKFNIGPSVEEYTGETTGDYASARVGIGYNYKTGGWTLNPAAAYTYEQLKIKGYTESDGVGSLVFGEHKLESSRLSASLTATYDPKDPNGWRPMFRVSVEHDFNDDDMKVNLGFDKDTMGALYLDRPDGTYGTLSAGISKNIGKSTSFSINATTIIGGDGVTGASGGISFKSKF